jgi:hypothetical protein
MVRIVPVLPWMGGKWYAMSNSFLRVIETTQQIEYLEN